MKFYEYRAWAWRQDIKPAGRKFILVALSEYADDFGTCYPKVATLASDTSQGESTVREHLNKLEKDGLIGRFRVRKTDGYFGGYRYILLCGQSIPAGKVPKELEDIIIQRQISADGDPSSAKSQQDPAPDFSNNQRQISAVNNNPLEQPIEQPCNIQDYLDKFWDFLKRQTPNEHMGRHSKKQGFDKIKALAKRKSEPIPVNRTIHALFWYYTRDDQTRNEGKFIKGLVPVMNGALYEPFLEYGPYKPNAVVSDEEAAAEKDDAFWEFSVSRYKTHDNWSAPGPRPDQAGCYAPKEILTRHGFEVTD